MSSAFVSRSCPFFEPARGLDPGARQYRPAQSHTEVARWATINHDHLIVTMLHNTVGVTLWFVFGAAVYAVLRDRLPTRSMRPMCSAARFFGCVTLLLSGFTLEQAAIRGSVSSTASGHVQGAAWTAMGVRVGVDQHRPPTGHRAGHRSPDDDLRADDQRVHNPVRVDIRCHQGGWLSGHRRGNCPVVAPQNRRRTMNAAHATPHPDPCHCALFCGRRG